MVHHNSPARRSTNIVLHLLLTPDKYLLCSRGRNKEIVGANAHGKIEANPKTKLD